MDDESSSDSKIGQIKVKDFAKVNSKAINATPTPGPSKTKRTATKNVSDEPTTPAKKSRKRVSSIDTLPSTSKTSTVKKTAKIKDIKEPPSNNKLISQFFKPIDSDKKPQIIPASTERKKSDDDNGKENNVSEKSEKNTPVTSVTIPRARRKLCPGTNLKLVSNRYHDEDQTRMSEFYDKTKECEFNYYTTAQKSKLPTIIDGEIDIDSYLGVCLTEESRILDFNESQEDVKPLEQIEHELAKLIDRVENPVRDEADDERDRWNMEDNVVPVQNLTQQETQIHIPDTTPKKKGPRVKKTVICPKYKVISGTTFAVDAFRFGYIDGITHYFLTHFHSDHYIGLKKDFNRPLILSTVTASCVKKMVKVDPQYLIELNPNQSMIINDIKITAIDANHCPGAVMFAFEFPDKEISLHVGDFRASPEMESHPIFWNHNVNELYLDTTYLTSKYSLCSQEDCIRRAIEETYRYYEKHALDKVLIIVGAYVIGKEKVWTALAEKFNLKVWADKNRREALDAINNPNMIKYLVNDPKAAQMHVINMGFVNYDDLKNYLAEFENTFTHILAFKPSGWEKRSKPRHQGKISIVGLEYSEHSSYDELRRFVGFLRPRTIISTVPMGKDPNKTPTIPQEWYRGEIKPLREGNQLKIHDFATPKDSNSAQSSRSSTPIVSKLSLSVNKLNPSALKRRQETKNRVAALEVSDTIELDSD